MTLSPEQQNIVHRNFISILKRQRLRLVCETKDGRSYWKSNKGKILVLFRDEKGECQVQRLDRRSEKNGSG